jgi:hypothetical protein
MNRERGGRSRGGRARLQGRPSLHAGRRYGAFSRLVRLPFEVKELTVRRAKPAEVQKAVRRKREARPRGGAAALRRLDAKARWSAPPQGHRLETFIARERQASPSLDRRSVFGWEKDLARACKAG